MLDPPVPNKYTMRCNDLTFSFFVLGGGGEGGGVGCIILLVQYNENQTPLLSKIN